MNQPYIHFFPRDWLAEYKLRLLSPADRGLWIDMLCLMAMAEPYGYLINMGKALNDDEISRILSIDVSIYKNTLTRLLDSGVCSVDKNGVVYSRRLVKDYESRLQSSKYGKKGGGNPALKKKKKITNTITNTTTREPIKGDSIKEALKVLNSEFNQFWKAYPKKKSKIEAQTAWEKAVKKPAINVILEKLKEQSESYEWQKEDGQFIPLPATWLNKGRWDDEVVAVTAEPTTKPTSSHHKPVTIWELKQRLEAIDELISSLKSVLTSSYAVENKKAHPKEFAQLQELKSQRMDILKQMGECGK